MQVNSQPRTKGPIHSPGQSAVTRPSESLNHELQGSVYIVYKEKEEASVSDAVTSVIQGLTDLWEIPLREQGKSARYVH